MHKILGLQAVSLASMLCFLYPYYRLLQLKYLCYVYQVISTENKQFIVTKLSYMYCLQCSTFASSCMHLEYITKS